jgi:hypothetical protein
MAWLYNALLGPLCVNRPGLLRVLKRAKRDALRT